MIARLNLISTLPPHAAVKDEERRKTKAMAGLPYIYIAEEGCSKEEATRNRFLSWPTQTVDRRKREARSLMI